jgi:hypothetical protein
VVDGIMNNAFFVCCCWWCFGEKEREGDTVIDCLSDEFNDIHSTTWVCSVFLGSAGAGYTV